MLTRFNGAKPKRSPIYAAFIFLIGCGGGGIAGGSTGPSGCGSPGGLNENQKISGNQPGGVQLFIGDIAVAPSGDFVVFTMNERLAVGRPDTGVVNTLPVESPTRLAFSEKRDVVYVGSQADGKLHAIDVSDRKELWALPIKLEPLARIEVSKDDRRMLAASSNSSDVKVSLIDAEAGKVIAEHTVKGSIEDLEILPDDKRALLVPTHTWTTETPSTPLTVVTVMELEVGLTRTFDVPNCADNIVVTPSGARAFLAPTTCNQDPISYIDLTPGKEAYVKNLPGFGPVALAPDGVTAVGFLDATAADESLFENPAQKPDPNGTRYHLMVIDTQSLAYKFFASGADLPRYAITPDGNVLLVDSLVSAPTRIFETKTGTFHAVEGPQINLDNFVISSDSAHAYVLQQPTAMTDPKPVDITKALYDLDIVKATSARIDLSFEPPNINISPDDQTLFLREDEANICVFSLADRACTSRISGLVAGKPAE